MKKQLGILLALAAVMACLCVGTWSATRAQIGRNQEAAMQAALREVLPGTQAFTQEEYEDPEALICSVWRADEGYAIETKAYGYHDDVRLLVGVGNDGAVRALKVLSMDETPGLGDQARHDEAFLSQFVGTKSDATLSENVDALSGATVTTKAFIKAVNAASAYVTGADVSSGATQSGG